MAWVQISEEEAKNHPYWDKFCWVRWLFITMGMLKAVITVIITILGIEEMKNNLRQGYDIVGALLGSSYLILMILWTVVILLFGFKRQYNKHLPFLSLIYIPISLYLYLPIGLLLTTGPENGGGNFDYVLIICTLILFIYFGIYSIYKLIAENTEVFRLQYMKQIKVTQYYNNYYN